jgi:DNA-binding MarR family transcriptional regulator
MTKTVTALEDAGLATRTRSATDRRAVVVAATAKGRAVLERGRAARVRTIAALLAPLSKADRRALAHAAAIIAAALAR